jgi:hypothetical protein
MFCSIAHSVKLIPSFTVLIYTCVYSHTPNYPNMGFSTYLNPGHTIKPCARWKFHDEYKLALFIDNHTSHRTQSNLIGDSGWPIHLFMAPIWSQIEFVNSGCSPLSPHFFLFSFFSLRISYLKVLWDLRLWEGSATIVLDNLIALINLTDHTVKKRYLTW